jgi:O-antigen/teichoic acid export membrane protein
MTLTSPPRAPSAVIDRTRLRTAALSRLGGSLTTAVGGLATTALLLRALGSAGYGALAFGLSTVVLSAVLAQLGLGTAVMQRVAALDQEDDGAGVVRTITGGITVLSATSGVAAIGMVVVLTLVSPLPASRSFVVGIGLAGLVLGTNAAMAASFIARGLGRFVMSEIPTAALVLLQLSATLVVIGADNPRPETVAIAFGVVGLIMIAVAVGLILRLVPATVFMPSVTAALDMLRVAAPFAVAGIALQAIAQADVFALGLSRPASALGTYEPTLRVVDRMMLLLPLLLLAGFVPLASRISIERHREEFRAFFVSASKAGFVLGMPVLTFLAWFPRLLPTAVFGSDFGVSPTVVRILLVGYAANMAFGLNSGALVAVGEAKSLRRPYLLSLVAMVVLAASLTPAFGAVGAATATSATYVVLNVVVSSTLRDVARISLFDAGYLGTVGSGLGIALLTGFLPGPPMGLFAACLLVLLLWLVWVTIIAAAGWLSREDVALFVPLRQRVR